MNPQRISAYLHRLRLTAGQIVVLSILLIICGVGFVSSTAQSPQDATATSSNERELIDEIPKHLPIKVKIKKEKEKAVKDLKNDKWLRDFELEVTNIGDKPIYFLYFVVTLSDITDSGGTNLAFPLRYGRFELGSIENKAEPDDIPLKPGETYIFKAFDSNVRGWDVFRRNHNKPQPKKLTLNFVTLSFGNGTGFLGTDGHSIPEAPKEKSSLDRCEQEQNKSGPKVVKGQRMPSGIWPATYAANILPAKSLLAKFLSADLSHSLSASASPQPDIDCCPGNGCGRYKFRSEYRCYGCPPVNTVINASCSDQLAICRDVDQRSFFLYN